MGSFRKLALLVLSGLGLSAAACTEDKPLGCTPEAVITLEASPLTDMADGRLHRVGDAFVLVGVEGDTVRWNRVSEAGILDKSKESTLTVPADRVVGPWIGLTGKQAPGDQIAVVIGRKRPPAMAGQADFIELQVITQNVGGTASAPMKLVDLPPVPEAEKTLKVVMGTSQSGRRAALAWGFAEQRALPKFVTLKPDGELSGPPTDVRDVGAKWDCLAFVPNRSEFGVSTVERAVGGTTEKSNWVINEYREDGVSAGTVRLVLDVTEMECPTVAPKPKGYVLSWQNTTGTYFADYTVKEVNGMEMNVVNKDIVRGAVRFGGPQHQPKVACLAPVGKDFSITYAYKTGPQVDRFDVFGNPVGSTLHLPVDGSPGPISAWPANDTFFLTYLDQPGASGSGGGKGKRRLFLRVVCPPVL